MQKKKIGKQEADRRTVRLVLPGRQPLLLKRVMARFIDDDFTFTAVSAWDRASSQLTSTRQFISQRACAKDLAPPLLRQKRKDLSSPQRAEALAGRIFPLQAFAHRLGPFVPSLGWLQNVETPKVLYWEQTQDLKEALRCCRPPIKQDQRLRRLEFPSKLPAGVHPEAPSSA